MGLTREERKLLHTKQERVRSEGRRPEANSMNDGAQVLGYKGKVLYQFTKYIGVLYETRLEPSATRTQEKGVQDAVWSLPTMESSWVDYHADYQGASYFKDSEGMVHLRGLIKDGSSAGATMFTLPSGYRPALREIFNTRSSTGSCKIDVYPTGIVEAGTGGSTSWTSLSGIKFSAKKLA